MNPILVAFITVIVMDAVWLTLNYKYHSKLFTAVQGSPIAVRLIPAIAVYILIPLAVTYFAVNEAKSVKKEVADLVKTLLPSDYKTYSTYVAGYAGYMTEMFEYNSDIFAEVSKRPVVRVGIILLSEGKYNLEVIVSEPVFKTSERPNQEKK